jgi:hypothetical protein
MDTLITALISAVISAVVSLAVTLLIRLLDRGTVEWMVVGKANWKQDRTDSPNKMRYRMELWNTGDADAYDVRLRRCNGKDSKTGKDLTAWETLEAGCIKSGTYIEFQMLPSADCYKDTWVQVIFRTSPVYRHKPTVSKKIRLYPLIRYIGAWSDDQPYSEIFGRGWIRDLKKDS